MKIAVVAAEDQRFPQHRGFDLDSIVSAVEDYRDGDSLRGASTISQQVAKNLFLWPGRSFIRKLLEAYFTVIIEFGLSKRRILEIYLNVAQFGPDIYGAAAASEAFFGKTAADLVVWEAASLAAVLPSPATYSVQNPTEYVVGRRVWIINQMYQLGGENYLSGIDGDPVANKQVTRR